MNETFDTEFKLYMHNKGINIDNNLFDLKFNPPQNFASYRQAEMDTARVNSYTVMSAVPHVSKRFALKRFLGLTSEELAENERMWREENVDEDVSLSASAELRSAGVTAGGMSNDLGSLTAPPQPLPGEEGAPPEGGNMPEPASTPAAGQPAV
jgi:hypothetical protein